MCNRKSIKKYRESLSRNEARILSDLSYKGKGLFTLEDIRGYIESPKDLLHNLIRKNWILRIKNGVYLIAPLEAGELGAHSYTIHSFVIASNLVNPYYISHWSALNYYGFTEQIPPAVYITSTKPRNRRRILDTEFIFVAVPERKMFGITEIEIDKNMLKISTPEKTIVDCLDHPEHCGGIGEVAKGIYFERNNLDLKTVVSMAERMRNRTIIKRLGYILDVFRLTEYIEILKRIGLSEGYSKLDPKLPDKGKINEKWAIRINADINPEQWTK
jgi:predicted transcriptional regulator of viral defense system